MNNLLKVIPAEGVQVRKENGEVIPKEGCSVPNTRYYRKRITDRDLLLADDASTGDASETAPVKSSAKTKPTKEDK